MTRPKHELRVGAIWAALTCECTCGWTAGRMKKGVDYLPVWQKHRDEVSL